VDPVLVLDEPSLQVEPGAEVRTRVTVTGGDGSSGIERYRLEIVGDAARWAQVAPRHLSVRPGEAEVAELVFRPPHTAAAPVRVLPFGVRASSPEHRDRSGIVEGELLLTPVPGITARIEPAAAAGRWGAGFVARFTNSGRGSATLRISGTGAPGALRFAVAPATPSVPAGGTADVLVSVRPRRPRLAGRPQRHEFGVEYRSELGGDAARLPAVFEQHAVLPVAVAALMALAGAVVVAGAVLLWWVPGPAAPEPQAAPPAPRAPVASAAPAPAPEPVNGFVVIYGPPTPVDDTVNARAAERFADRLRAAGVPARLVDSRESDQLDDGLSGLLVVLQDGFPDRSAATAECAARRSLAPSCTVVAPR
jgi:hypothetical protein